MPNDADPPTTDVAGTDELSYLAPIPRWTWWVLVFVAVVWVLGAAFDVIFEHRIRANSVFLLVACAGPWFARRCALDGAIANPTLIRRTWPARRIEWSDVDYVKALESWDTVRVVLHDGSVKPTGFPTSYAEQLAAIGGKPLREG